VFFKCRAVDAEGPLARLKNMLFNKKTLMSVAQWVTVSISLSFDRVLMRRCVADVLIKTFVAGILVGGNAYEHRLCYPDGDFH